MPAVQSLPELPRARHLLSAQALARLLAARAGAGACLFEVGCGGSALFEADHIPGARWLDTAWLETGALYNKVSDPALLALLLSLGIGHDSTVLLYGRSTLAAARAAHLLLYAGVADVRLLDGGFDGWRAAGLACESGPSAPSTARADFGLAFPGCPHFLADAARAARVAASRAGALVSVRTWREHTGQTSGYSYIDACGDIPGARWGRAGREGDVNSMSAYQLADGRMRPAAQIVRMWAASGIGEGQHLVFYCGTGWRASLAFYYAWLMGRDDIAVYDGGWFEWSSNAANPVVCRAAQRESA